MKTMSVAILVAFLFGGWLVPEPALRAQTPIDPAFTYQGRLWDQGDPASGLYDFRFRLFDAASGGSQAGPTLEFDQVLVDQGVFTVRLDFEAALISGQQGWLELEVRPAGSGAYTSLQPRTALAAAPYALGAIAALPGSVSADSVLPGAVGALQIDQDQVQRRVLGDCPPGQSIRRIRADGSVECGSGGAVGNAWLLGGNDNAVAGRDFIGTLNSIPLELRADNQPVARFSAIESGIGYAANVVLGSPFNLIESGVRAGTIGGGGLPGSVGEGRNRVSGNAGTVAGGLLNVAGSRGSVGGGEDNFATGSFSTVAGGEGNWAPEAHTTVAGGQDNRAVSELASVGGGFENVASRVGSTVAGGLSNTASARSSSVSGGELNCAGGSFSWVGGRRAKVRPGVLSGATGRACSDVAQAASGGDQGTFVWADSQNADFVSTGSNQFLVRAAGGVYFGGSASSPSLPTGRFINTSTGAHLTDGGTWANSSSRSLKTGFEAMDPGEVLARLSRLPILRWRYRDSPAEGVHLGPVAEDFHALFGLGADATSISTVDASGVALAAIQGLNEKLEEENRSLRDQLSEQRAALEQLRREMDALHLRVPSTELD